MLAQFYLGYKQTAMSAGELFNEFCEMLGVRDGITSFWGLAICHTTSHNMELNEVLRRNLFKMKFHNGDCVINHAAPVPPGKVDKDGKPIKPIIKYTFIYNLLTGILEKHMRERQYELGEMDIRSLNQAISTIYELDKHDLLQAKKLKMYISPETKDLIGKCFFCPESQIPALLKNCKIEDLVYVQIYWSITGFLMSERSKGVNPGFDGFQWIKDTFPGRFIFIKLKAIQIKESAPILPNHGHGYGNKKTQGSINPKIGEPKNQETDQLKKGLDEESFPSLGGKQSKKTPEDS